MIGNSFGDIGKVAAWGPPGFYGDSAQAGKNGFGTSDFGFRGSGARQFIWRAFSYILPSVPQVVFIDKGQKWNLIFLLLFYTMGREKAIFCFWGRTEFGRETSIPESFCVGGIGGIGGIGNLGAVARDRA